MLYLHALSRQGFAGAATARWVRRFAGCINALPRARAGRTAAHFSGAPIVPSAFCAGFVVLATLAVAAPAQAQDTTPPGAPASLIAAAGDGRVRLVWTAPTDPGTSPVTGYQFRYAQGASVPSNTAWTAISGGSQSSVLITGLSSAAHAFEVRAVNSAGGGAAATMLATPAAVCSAPNPGARREVWSGTMTVGVASSPDGTGFYVGNHTAGFLAGTGGYGSLPPGAGFTVGGVTYNIDQVTSTIRADTRLLHVRFSSTQLLPPVRAALRFHYCGETRDFGGAGFSSNTYLWQSNNGIDNGIDFSLYPTREIALSLPPNNDATGAPVIVSDIAGEAHVGRPLTASAGTVADADGLPSALNYQWFRVDGSNVETEIDGATRAAYTPTAADLGHRLRVKVSFTDNLGGAEEVDVTINVTDPPGAPASLTAAAGDGRVRLVWTAPTDTGGAEINEYEVRHAQGASVPAGTAWLTNPYPSTAFTLLVEGLANGVAHAFEVRAVNRAGDGAAATVSATPAAGCSAPALGARREVWSGTMTVGKFSSINWGLQTAGFRFLTGSGSLTQPRHFSIGATRYDIMQILVVLRDDGRRRLTRVNFSNILVPAPVGAALQFHSCSETREFSSASTAGGNFYVWYNEFSIDFSLYPTREIALSLPPNNDATGAPAIVSDIAGMTQVGRTLTASEGNVADADGRPSALNYQWFRVDGSNVETEIDGATGTTYTPVTADLGHRFKVKTSFFDNFGSPEVRESLETPTVEQPTLMTIAAASAIEGSALTFDVTLSPATDRQVTVGWTVSTSGGNTASTNDLTGTTSGRLTFAANETSQTITLNTVQDEVYEGDETVTVTLRNPNANAVLGTERAATGTIVNNEALPTMTLVLADSTIQESDDPDQTGHQHRTTVTATLDIAVEGEVRVSIISGPALRLTGSAIDGTVLSIPAGQKTSSSVIVQALDNDVDEPDRTAVITATGARINTGYLDQTDLPLGPNPSLTITDDDDPPTVTLILSPASVRESDDGASGHASTVTASLSHPSSEATTVTVSAAAVSPAVAGDFALSGNKVLTIPARETRSTGTVTVTANDNNVDAADKAVTVSGAAANTQGVAGNPDDVTATIRDDEATPRVALVLGTNSIAEDAGTTVKATIPHPSSHATVVTITAAPGDFTVGGTLTIPAGSTESPTVTLTATDNETDAPDKQVTVNATARNDYGIVLPVGAALTIADDDPAPVVTLVLSPSTVRESDDPDTNDTDNFSAVTALLDRPSSKPTTVTVSGAAVAPAVAGDFQLSGGTTLEIPAGQLRSTASIFVAALDNIVDAPIKTVRISGVAVNANPDGAVNPQVEDLTIEDDDLPPTVTLTLSRTTTNEGDSTAITVRASLSHPSSEGTTITVSAAAVAPAVPGNFTLTGGTLTITAGQTASTGTVTIAPVDNETDAPDKTVTVSATVVNTQGYEQGTPADMMLAIRDDDPAPVASLVLMPASIGENGGETEVTARLDHPSSEDTIVVVTATAVNPAVAGDFTQTGTMLTIAAGSQDSTGTVTIGAVDNNVDAPDKQVTVSATASNSQGVRRASNAAAGMANVALTDAALEIRDDDPPPTAMLHLVASSIGENGGSTTVTARLTHPSSEPTTVTITAAANDFTLSGGGLLTIPALATESIAPVTLTAVDDDTDAPDKQRTVLATAVNGRGPGHVMQPAPVDLTIEDDDPPPTVTLHLGANANTIGENNGSTTVTARLSHPSSEATTVTVSAAAVSPALAADFRITGTVLSIPAGGTASGTATIRAVNNITDAPDKQVTVSATAENGKLPAPGHEPGTPADVVLTIADDDPPPTVTLRLSSATVTENGGEAAVTAVLSRPSSEATVVTVSTAAVSPAVAGDFTPTGAQLTVPAGLTASTGTVTIRANDNDIDTANKRVRVSATAANGKLPAPGVAGNPQNVTLTIEDDDTRGIALTPATLVLVEGFVNAPTDTGYTVALTSEPTGPVTVTVTGAGGLTVATASNPQASDFATSKTLTFTASNWQAAQTVTLRAGADSNAIDNNYMIGHRASGGDYGSVNSNLPVRVLDAQKSGATLVLTVDRAEIPEGGGAAVIDVTATLGGNEPGGVEPEEYSVVLSVTAGTAATTDFTFSQASLRIGGSHDYGGTFQTTAQIGITPVNDGLDEGDETVTVTATATPARIGTSAATVLAATVKIVDDDTRGVTVTPVQLELGEGGSRSYTVKLDSQPTGSVTVTPSKSGDGDISFMPALLSFDTNNWESAQTVTVSAAEDGDPLDDQATMSHAVSGADYGSNNVRAASVQVTAADNERRGVIVSPLDLDLTEGGTGTYTVRLNTLPTGTVTVRPVATGDPDVSVVPTSLTFTTLNWETEKTVTVSAAEDADVNDDRASISHTVSGADYGSNNVPGPEALVTVTDSGQTTTTGTISVSHDTIREASGTRSFKVTVELDGKRAMDTPVTVLIRGGTASVNDFTASPAAFSLVIPSGETTAQRTISLYASPDNVEEGDETILVEASARDLTFVSAEVTIEDDDEKGIVVSTPSLRITEQGREASYTVKLGSEPTGEVTVTPTVTGDDDVTVEPPTLSFTASNWSRTQTVTVRALTDPDGDDETAMISHEAAGADYDGLVGQSVSVTVDDDDPASRKVTLSLSPDRVDEGGVSQSVTVTAALDGAARAGDTEVQVTVTGNTAQAVTDFETVQPFTVTILEGQSGATGTFSFTPVNDRIDEGDETVSVGGTVTGLSVDSASLLLVDDDDRGVTASPLAVTVDEEGDQTYTLVLDTQPTGDVAVRLSVSGNRDVTVEPASLIFTLGNWNTARTVTVLAASDDDAADDTASVRHAVSGADYGGVRAGDIPVTVRDNDTRGVTISAESVQLREGGRVTYTVVLDTQPTGTVTVRPSLADGSDSDVRVSPSALSFSTSSWKTPKTVTVSAVQDGDSDLDNATVVHAVSGADYGEAAVEASQVSVTVTDDDVLSTAVVLRLSTDTVREGGGETQITVTAELDASPRADATAVTLDLEGVENGAQEGEDFAATGTVTLTIAAGGTSATARVSVTPVNDNIDEGPGEALRLVAETASGLVLQPSSFELTIEDDDEKGIVLSRTTLTVREEGSQTYTVRLKSQPTGDVAVALVSEGADGGEVTPRPQQLVFTETDWRTVQTVTVEAAEDPDGDDGLAEIVHTASGGDYGGVAVTLPVTVDDNDQTSRSVQLSLAPDRVEEDAVSETVTVTAALDGAARSTDTDVAVQAAGGTATAGTDFADFGTVTVLIPAGLTEGTQTFSFSPVDDSVDEGLSETVVLGGTVQGLTVRTATLTIADNDGRGIELPEGSLTLDEGGNATYDVSLATEPTGTVTVRVTVSGDRDVSVEPGSLTFTASSWNTARTVTVTAAQDDDAIVDIAELRHSASGADYGGVRALPLAVEVREDDTRGVTINPESVQFREGGRATYTVVLDTRPSGTVTVRPSLAGGSDSDVRVSPSALSFSTSNWSTPKTVTVSAGQDGDSSPDSATVEHAVSGADYGEAAVTAAQVTVTVTDDDVPSTVIVLRLSADTVREGGGRTQITVTGELDAAPREDDTAVTLDLEGVANGAQAGADFAATGPVTLTIAAGGTSATALVPVEPVNDDIDEGTGEALRLTAQTTASGLTLQPSSFDLTIEDDDEKGIVLSRTTLTVREEGSQTYTVRLKSQPTGTVTVSLTALGAGGVDLTFISTSLAFTANDWNTAQTVTVSAGGDEDSNDETATIAHAASGGDYGGQQADLPTTVLDKTGGPRAMGVTISPIPTEASEEHGPRYTKEAFLALPAGAVHGPGTRLTFTLTFNLDVTVTLDPDIRARPELVLYLFGRERRARYTGPVGTLTDTMVFTWTVARGDNDPKGLTVSGIALNGSTIRDSQDRDTEAATFRAVRYKAHRVRGGLHTMRLVVSSGTALEGAPFTVRVQRSGGFDELAHAIVQVTDSGVAVNQGLSLLSFPFDEASRQRADPQFSVGAVTPPGDGVTNVRTLILRLFATDVGDNGVSYWYDKGGPAEVTVPVVDNGLATDAPSLSVGPADAFEVPDATLSFEVRLDPASEAEVTVDYATRDGTATAGMDYTAVSDTLTFIPGETVKTVEVPVLLDDHDEGVETVWLVLSNPSGAVIARGENSGEIHNNGLIPKAWIARFGRTVAEQMLEAVEGRMRAAPAPGVEVSLVGEQIGGSPGPGSETEREAWREDETLRDAQRLTDWLNSETDDEEAQRRSRVVTSRDMLTGSAFTLTEETPGRDLVSFWGRGAVTSFDGREGDLTLDGEVVIGMLGADWRRGRWTTGLILSHSSAEGGYSGAPGAGDGSGSGAGTGGKVEATLTGLFPWTRHALSDRLEAWGMAGYGEGDLTVTPKKPGTDEDGAVIRADLDLRMAVVGLRGTMLDGGGDGLTLTAKTDAMVVQTASGRGLGADGGNLEPARATVTRLRLGLEANRPIGFDGGATLTPGLEIGVRHDGGDAETGFGLDLGIGLALSDPERGLQAELRGRGLLAHESKGFRDLGFSGSLAWEGKPGSDLGAKLGLTQTVGGSSSGGADALLSRSTLDGLAANDPGSGSGAGDSEGGDDELKSRRLELKFGYGLPAFGGRFTWTPEAYIGLSDTGRDYSLGWRLVRGGSGDGGGSFEISFEARRSESVNDDTQPVHEVGLRFVARF